MIALLTGDALTTLRSLPSESVHCCITSPPYWGLRDYGTATWRGGNPECRHAARRNYEPGGRQSRSAGSARDRVGDCRRCGARRVDQQLGLEQSPELYVDHLVEVFREVRRVLRPDGTLWLNLGDSYATGAGLVGSCPGGGRAGGIWAGSRGTHGGSAKQRATGNAVGPGIELNSKYVAIAGERLGLLSRPVSRKAAA